MEAGPDIAVTKWGTFRVSAGALLLQVWLWILKGDLVGEDCD